MSEIIKSQKLGEEYMTIEHPSGLTLLLCPMKGYSTAYALFATKYGSIDTCFKNKKTGERVTIPDGTAHYLEHKLFESEDGDAFARYAATGASANAYTSFDRTAYLFACSDRFEQSLEILLDFVTHPYFTPETVQKEQGIIGQEIRMYEDNPDWRVFFNLLGSLYENNPVRIDIAGTVESISHITADTLYECYNTFYNLRNMVLCVAGNFDVDTVVKLADQILKPAPVLDIERCSTDDPPEVYRKRYEQKLAVATPLFQIGFKGRSSGEAENLRDQVLDEILMDIVAGEASPLYRRLYDDGLINSTFMTEVMAGRDYMCLIFQGESKDPDRVNEEICKEIARLKTGGIDKKTFERCKKATYGRYIGMFGKVEAVAGLLVLAHFSGVNMYELLDIVAGATLEMTTERLRIALDVTRNSISIVSSPEN